MVTMDVETVNEFPFPAVRVSLAPAPWSFFSLHLYLSLNMETFVHFSAMLMAADERIEDQGLQGYRITRVREGESKRERDRQREIRGSSSSNDYPKSSVLN